MIRSLWPKPACLFLLLLAVSCGGDGQGGARELVLCGQGADGPVRAYHVRLSAAGDATIEQAIDLPEDPADPGRACPVWRDDRLAVVYGPAASDYSRDVHLLDLDDGRLTPWLHVDGESSVEEVVVIDGSPRALLLSNRDGGYSCAQIDFAEAHFNCLYRLGDLFIADERGAITRLTDGLTRGQPPVCEMTLSLDGRLVAVRQTETCVTFDPGASNGYGSSTSRPGRDGW